MCSSRLLCLEKVGIFLKFMGILFLNTTFNTVQYSNSLFSSVFLKISSMIFLIFDMGIPLYNIVDHFKFFTFLSGISILVQVFNFQFYLTYSLPYFLVRHVPSVGVIRFNHLHTPYNRRETYMDQIITDAVFCTNSQAWKSNNNLPHLGQYCS